MPLPAGRFLSPTCSIHSLLAPLCISLTLSVSLSLSPLSPPQVPFDYGYGQHVWNNPPNVPWSNTWVMVDTVRAPVERGDYVMRWRWDTEQNPQVWTHCADVTIV